MENNQQTGQLSFVVTFYETDNEDVMRMNVKIKIENLNFEQMGDAATAFRDKIRDAVSSLRDQMIKEQLSNQVKNN
jgi:hypothetical protein